MKNLLANRIAPDETPRSAASHLGLFCLPVSHKRDDSDLNELIVEGSNCAIESILATDCT